MQQIRLIIHHLQRNQSGRRIAKELGLSRNTVKLYLDRITRSSFSLDAIAGMKDSELSALVYPSLEKYSQDQRRSDFSERTDYFLSELKRTGVTRRLLWEEYKREFSAGYAYPQFCELLSREKKLTNASMHFEYQPADMLLVDFAGDTVCRLTLLQIMEDRYRNGATIITSQLPVNKWYDYINEPTLADAILDRLTAHAHKIELRGESLRKLK